MIVIYTHENIFDLPDYDHMGVCVTTNGNTRKDGTAVMGAGNALEANKRYACDGKLGDYLKQYGNRVFNLGIVQTKSGQPYRLISFPTKHSWREKSDIKLIEQSAHQLMEFATKFELSRVFLPPAGCGLGGLNWNKDVAPVLEKILDNRFCVVRRPVRE